jgi:hypothetical protein
VFRGMLSPGHGLFTHCASSGSPQLVPLGVFLRPPSLCLPSDESRVSLVSWV